MKHEKYNLKQENKLQEINCCQHSKTIKLKPGAESSLATSHILLPQCPTQLQRNHSTVVKSIYNGNKKRGKAIPVKERGGP
jgi:hypothetical protein